MVQRGKLIQSVDLTTMSGLDNGGVDTDTYIEIDLFDENGNLVRSGDYFGRGEVISGSDGQRLILGDTYRDANLPEYRVGSESEDSRYRIDAMLDGFKAGVRGQRASLDRDMYWRDGFAIGKRLRLSWPAAVRKSRGAFV